MRPLRQFSSLVLLMCVAAAISSAQEERTSLPSRTASIESGATESGLSFDGVTFRKNVDEVEVRFFATDPLGRPVPRLKASDVKVIADGRFSPEIKSFRARDSAAIELGILVDLSESVRPDMHLQVVAFTNELSDLLQPSRDREFVVAFSNTVTLLQPPTSDFARVRQILEHSKGDHNLTSLFDAVVKTCRDQFGSVRTGREKRILLLFTDGVDNLSMHSLEDAVEAARESGVIIYAVTQRAGDPEGRRVLERLASQTGGALELIRKSKEPELSVASLGAIPPDEYTLSFRPPDPQPGFHALELKATGAPTLILRTPAGYFLNPRP